jgi:hypothetical protein
MTRSKFSSVLTILSGASIIFSVGGCAAKTLSGSSGTDKEAGKFFDAASVKEQTVYFEKVKDHFQQIGRPLNDDEVKQHTAAIFIISVPIPADVFVGGNFMGKTNASQLYFKPGKQEVVFKKGDTESTKELDLTPGKNLSIVVKF